MPPNYSELFSGNTLGLGGIYSLASTGAARPVSNDMINPLDFDSVFGSFPNHAADESLHPLSKAEDWTKFLNSAEFPSAEDVIEEP